jgi:Rrf2 family protein
MRFPHGRTGLRVSQQTEYGLRAAVTLARLWPAKFVQSRDLAEEEKLPNKFLEAILLTLRRGGFLESKVGRDGGYRLSRPPEEIKVGDLVRRLEGRLTATESQRGQQLSAGELAVQLLNKQLSSAIDGVLDEMTLKDLLDFATRAGAGHQMYYI